MLPPVLSVRQNDGELKRFTLKEPSSRRFTYLRGLSLLTAADDGEPIAARFVCQYLGRKAAREDWGGKIGVFSDETFHDLFDNADIVNRASGDNGVLTGNNPDGTVGLRPTATPAPGG